MLIPERETVKTLIATLAIALTTLTVNAELQFHRSSPDPQTQVVTLWMYESDDARFVGISDIAEVTTQSDGARYTDRIHNCRIGTKGGTTTSVYANGRTYQGVWMSGGPRIADTMATNICYHALVNARIIKQP
jgi:hypothetical protein